ncbi:hypothetical protein PS685_04128 [Pseudomonas fluorescens]|uniref:Uncharacterized protein n=1 Tax=Pseudomonas fluorescens TaxID=294 RepID=A0A5E6ZD79_PSEFL|nr:hypothetical protein PS685_04128 [Pseudomonas fluorescens]
MSIRQPGVERYDRQLHGESNEEAQHQDVLGGERHLGFQQLGVAEGNHAGVVEVDQHQTQDRHQHDQAGSLSEDEELGGGVDTGFLAVRRAMTPERDEEIHRHQHHFPEEEEHEQVDGEEHANHTAQDPHQVQVEEAHVTLDFFPRTQHRQHTEQAGEQDHQQRQAVQRQVHADTEAGNPGVLELKGPGRIGARRRCK